MDSSLCGWDWHFRTAISDKKNNIVLSLFHFLCYTVPLLVQRKGVGLLKFTVLLSTGSELTYYTCSIVRILHNYLANFTQWTFFELKRFRRLVIKILSQTDWLQFESFHVVSSRYRQPVFIEVNFVKKTAGKNARK